jgi:hypothetical protein
MKSSKTELKKWLPLIFFYETRPDVKNFPFSEGIVRVVLHIATYAILKFCLILFLYLIALVAGIETGKPFVVLTIFGYQNLSDSSSSLVILQSIFLPVVISLAILRISLDISYKVYRMIFRDSYSYIY